jgi:hypothetical protein
MIHELITNILAYFIHWSKHYDQGWNDGWNACRSARPEDRVFKGPVWRP